MGIALLDKQIFLGWVSEGEGKDHAEDMLLEATNDDHEACCVIEPIEIFQWKRGGGACCRGTVTIL